MNHYEILEVSKNATKTVIESAFRKKSLLCHPDKLSNKDDPQKREMFHRIQEAKRILTDDEERRRYDRQLEEEAMGDSYEAQAQRAQREFWQAYMRNLAQELAREQARQYQRQKAEQNVSEGLSKGFKLVIVVPICLIVVLGAFIIITSKPNPQKREQFYSSRPQQSDTVNEEIVGRVIAIDFGTSYSRVGVYVNGSIEVIPNEQGNRFTPSFISFSPHCDVFIGELAQKQLVLNPENTVFNLKRLIGRRSSDLYVKKYPSTFNLLISQSLPQIKITCEMKTMIYSIEELTALLFSKLKADAEAFIGEPVTNVVLTVPSQFNDLQRQMTKDAGAIAGLNVVKLINEPTAAMLCYGLDDTYKGQEYSVVFHLGGGTLDVTLFSTSGNQFEVLASSGNTQSGGSDFNTRVVEHFASVFGNKTGLNIHKSTTTLLKINREVEMVKKSLCTKENINFPLKIESIYQGHDLRETLTMSQFEQLNKANLNALLKPVEQVLKAAEIKKQEVGQIILVGGSTCLPGVQSKLKTFFDGKEPTKIDNAGVAVLYGAVMMAATLGGEKGIPEFGIIDVTAFSLGVGATSGTSKLIDRYSYTPAAGSERFSKQRTEEVLSVNVYEGEHRNYRHNNYLGSFQLSGVAYGAEVFEVVFNVDTSGILKVSANNVGKYKSKYIKVRNDALRYTDEEIGTMHNNVQTILMSENKAKKRIFIRNELERYVYFILQEVKMINEISYEDSQTLKRVINEEIVWLEEHQDVKKLFYLKRKRELQLKIEKVFKKYKDIENPSTRFIDNTELVEEGSAHDEL